MRGLDTNVKRIRRKVFKEIARVGFESEPETLVADIEAIPYHIVQERATYRESIYRERAVASERVRLAMGMSLRPENTAVHITAGLEASNIDEKYYEPPLMQVIPSAVAVRTMARMQGFMPGASPPLVRMPIRFNASITPSPPGTYLFITSSVYPQPRLFARTSMKSEKISALSAAPLWTFPLQ